MLLADMDPQSNATSGLGIDPKSLQSTIYNCLIKGDNIGASICRTTVNGLDLLPASADLAGAEVELVEIENRESLLKLRLNELGEQYEFVFVDCPPTLGLLTINALVAADAVLIPVQCEYYAMEGLGRLVTNIDRIRQSLNPRLEVQGVLLTMYDSRNTLARQVAEEIRGHFKEKVYRTVIPRNVALAEAPSYGRPAMLYNVASTGAQAYLSLAKEFLSHGEKSAW